MSETPESEDAKSEGLGGRAPRADQEWERLVPKIQARRAQRKAAVRGYETAVAEISRILFACDPIGINFETNTDEYDAEAASIVPRLTRAATEAEAGEIVFSEFQRWFGVDTAGPRSRYERVSSEIWQAWERLRRGRP